MSQEDWTHDDKVIDRLARHSYVTNFWAIENYILRLGAVIYRLRTYDGEQIIGVYGNKINNYTPREKLKNRKNYHYVLKDRCTLEKDGTVTLK